jgi:hypothetical protein
VVLVDADVGQHADEVLVEEGRWGVAAEVVVAALAVVDLAGVEVLVPLDHVEEVCEADLLVGVVSAVVAGEQWVIGVQAGSGDKSWRTTPKL